MSRPSFEAGDALPALHASEFWLLAVDRGRGVALLRRSACVFATVEAVQAENVRVIQRLGSCMTDGVVVDMRAAPANNDPVFEQAMLALRAALAKKFRRVIVLVTSAVGELQMKRIHTGDQHGFVVTRSESEAWRLAAGAQRV